jgi:hypothetical protein
MFVETIHNEKCLVRIGRDSDATITVLRRKNELFMKISVRSTVADQELFTDKEMPFADGAALVYKMWSEGDMIQSKMLIHLQNDVISYLTNKITFEDLPTV